MNSTLQKPSPPVATLLLGGFLFSLVSIAAYSCWAFGGGIFRSTASLYSACAIVFIILGGTVLHFVTGRKMKFWRLGLTFAIGFFLYACCWSGFYFWLKKVHGETFGNLIGLVALSLVFRLMICSKRGILIPVSVLFLASTIGYYLGELSEFWLKGTYQQLPNLGFKAPTAGKLAWGFFHGFGLGFGLTFALQWFSSNQSTTSEGS